MSGGGNPPPGFPRPGGGAPGPGLLGMAGAGLPPAGTGGGALAPLGGAWFLGRLPPGAPGDGGEYLIIKVKLQIFNIKSS